MEPKKVSFIGLGEMGAFMGMTNTYYSSPSLWSFLSGNYYAVYDNA